MKVGYRVDGSKTLAGLLGLATYFLLTTLQGLEPDPTIYGTFLGLMGVGLGHKAVKASRPQPSSSSESPS